jgi:glutathione S-transferase
MKLIGNYLLPFVRRVAISLHAVELPFEMQTVFVSKNPEQARPFNPVVRIPTLVLGDGETLVESYAILDAIDQMVGPERALTSPEGKPRREVMKITAIALASTDKGQWAFYKRRDRPEEKVYQPWVEPGGTCRLLVDRLLESHTGLEARNVARKHLHLFASSRIACFARCSLVHGEASETQDPDVIAFRQRLLYRL